MNPIDAEDFARITEWLEADLGGRVTHIERQARWRPAWWVELERDGETLPLYVRGARLDSPSAFSLDHERTFQTMLFERGIRVPRVHGWCEEPKAYVTDRVPGRDNFEASSDDDRRSRPARDRRRTPSALHTPAVHTRDTDAAAEQHGPQERPLVIEVEHRGLVKPPRRARRAGASRRSPLELDPAAPDASGPAFRCR